MPDAATASHWHAALRPWILSLEIASIATALTSAIGIPVGYLMARKRFFGQTLIDTFLILPLVLPPTVIGYVLLLALGRHGLLGMMTGGFSLLFSLPGAIVASAVVSFPLVVLPARAAFAAVPTTIFEETRLLGASPLQSFFLVAIPIARGGIFSGLLLGFGRALGEFGATIMVVGTSEQLRTLPLQIYVEAGVDGDFTAARPAVLTLAATSLIVISIANRFRWFEGQR